MVEKVAWEVGNFSKAEFPADRILGTLEIEESAWVFLAGQILGYLAGVRGDEDQDDGAEVWQSDLGGVFHNWREHLYQFEKGINVERRKRLVEEVAEMTWPQLVSIFLAYKTTCQGKFEETETALETGINSLKVDDEMGIDEIKLIKVAHLPHPALVEDLVMARLMEMKSNKGEFKLEGKNRQVGDYFVEDEEIEFYGKTAAETLVLSHFYLIRSIAGKFYNQGLPLLDYDDLVQIGVRAMLDKLPKYQWRKGNKLTTYMGGVHGPIAASMQTAINQERYVSPYRFVQIKAMNDCLDYFKQKSGWDLSIEDLVELAIYGASDEQKRAQGMRPAIWEKIASMDVNSWTDFWFLVRKMAQKMKVKTYDQVISDSEYLQTQEGLRGQILRTTLAESKDSAEKRMRANQMLEKQNLAVEADLDGINLTWDREVQIDENGLRAQELSKALDQALTRLTPRELLVICLHYGVLDRLPKDHGLGELSQPKYSLEEIACLIYGDFKKSERVRQFESKALRKIRNPSTSHGLKMYLSD